MWGLERLEEEEERRVKRRCQQRYQGEGLSSRRSGKASTPSAEQQTKGKEGLTIKPSKAPQLKKARQCTDAEVRAFQAGVKQQADIKKLGKGKSSAAVAIKIEDEDKDEEEAKKKAEKGEKKSKNREWRSGIGVGHIRKSSV